MIRGMAVLGAIAAGALAAQTATPNASVSGAVLDKGTGKPLANYMVFTSVNVRWVGDTVIQSASTKDVSSTTDAAGKYKLADLPPGSYRISVRNNQRGGPGVSREIAVNGSDLENIDFRVAQDATITGRVVDENREPVPNVMVWLVTREYYLGSVGYHYLPGAAPTNDLGEYTISGVTAGSPILLMVDRNVRNLPAHSETPLDPKLRKRVPMRTWYPNSPMADGGQAIVLQPGEKREGVDIEVKKSASYCVEGTASGPMGPAAMRFGVEGTQPSSGISSSGGVFTAVPGGVTADDGKFRVCDLFPATYRLSVQDKDAPRNAIPNYAAMEITITDKDVTGVRVTAMPGKPMTGEVVWDGEPPATPLPTKVMVSLGALFRASFAAEQNFARVEIPGAFQFDGVLDDDYSVRANYLAADAYVKDVTFGGRSVFLEPLRPSTAMSESGLRVIMAHDGATISAQVADKDGNPLSDYVVLLLPADARTEGALAARMVQGRTNQLGQYTSQPLAPGKYYVTATDERVEPTPEAIGRLWRARNRFSEVDAPPSGAAQVKLTPSKLD